MKIDADFQWALWHAAAAALARLKRLIEEAEFGDGEDHAVRLLDVATGLAVWVYRDSASIIGAGRDDRFEAVDYDNLDQLAAAVLERVERAVDAAE